MILDNANISPQDVGSWLYELDDDMTHMKLHLRERLSARYDKLTPNQQQAFEYHIQATKQAVQAKQRAAMEAEMQAQGGQLSEEAPVQ